MAMDFSDPMGALASYRQAMQGGRQGYEQALAQQMAALSQPADRQGALLRMAQGFLSPTKTGGFGESLGMAVGAYADGRDKSREQEMDRAMKLAQIQAARAKLQMEAAGQDFGMFEKGMALDEKVRRRQAWNAFTDAPSLQDVASGANAAAGFDMPVLPGSAQPLQDMDLFSPQPTVTEDRMQRFQPQPDVQESLPAAPNRIPPSTPPVSGPAPEGGARLRGMRPGGMPGADEPPTTYTAGPAPQPGQFGPMGFDTNMPIPKEGVQTLRTRTANDQIDARLAPQQPQAPQQAPQQPMQAQQPGAPEARALAEATQMLERLHSPQGRALRQADPEGWSSAEKAALETLNKFATTDTRNYGMAQRDPGFLDFLRQQAEAKRPQNIIDNRNFGNIPPGMQIVEGEDGGIRMVEIPGGPAERARLDEEARLASRQASQQRAGQTVLRAVTRGLEDFLPNVVSGDGVIGANSRAALSSIRGTAEYNLMAQIEDFRSNIGLDRLQQMREESPTGGALGQVPFAQQMRLERVLGDFDISQPLPILEENLRQLNNIYLDIMYGDADERAIAVREGKMSREQSAQIDQMYYETQFDEFGRRRPKQPVDGFAPPASPVDDILEKYGVR